MKRNEYSIYYFFKNPMLNILVIFTITSIFYTINNIYGFSSIFLYLNLGLLILYLYLNEFNERSDWKKIEKVFLFILLIGSTVLLFWVNHVFWIILLLEIQSFIILGNSAIFHISQSYKFLNATEAAFLYFLPSFSSLMCLLGAVINQTINFPSPISSYYFVVLALCIKLGAVPFHFWIPQVINNLNYSTIILLTGLNKIPLLYLLQLINPSSILLMILGFLSITIGTFFMLNIVKIKELVAYSGIINNGWILIIISINSINLIYIFFFTYLLSLILLINISKEKIYLEELKLPNCIFKKQIYHNIILYTSLINIGGLPPLFAFVLKYVIILNLYIYTNKILLIFYLIILSVISIFVYLRPLTSFNLVKENFLEKIQVLKYCFNEIKEHYKEVLTTVVTCSMPYLILLNIFIYLFD